MNHKTAFRQGMTDGIPIALGYMAVSFTFGIMAKNAGLTAFQAVLLSLTNLTSAGQFAGLGIITASASTLEQALHFLREDEVLEVTPESLRIRKVELSAQKRYAKIGRAHV